MFHAAFPGGVRARALPFYPSRKKFSLGSLPPLPSCVQGKGEKPCGPSSSNFRPSGEGSLSSGAPGAVTIGG
jgi:hypothetical protein